ncbi:helix-turn-helix domain-containing protein [Glacieibacterium sp.]|uniref:helix-turn-helix domain-containing protein n=1 Tax=Glacieibacterium sp. TaxID=2860237 RepID=UPI003B00206D
MAVMSNDTPPFDARRVDPRVRLAMRIFEFEQTAVPSNDHVAARVGLSPFHFSRLFSEQVGESCAAYSRRIRLENSNNQLMHDPMPLDVVAASFGYASQSAYTRAFARHFGMPPLRFAAAVLGQTQADYAAAQLGPASGGASGSSLLPDEVRLVERSSRQALARRFYGHDTAGHWRKFLEELPAGVLDGAELAGMAYDSPRVTPGARWRYDCAVVFAGQTHSRRGFDYVSGLDLVELPGGLHAEATLDGTVLDIWRATVGLFTQWLPQHDQYRTDGDPVVHWLHASPLNSSFPATATIRIHSRESPPTLNLRPLTPYGRPAGHRTLPAID